MENFIFCVVQELLICIQYYKSLPQNKEEKFYIFTIAVLYSTNYIFL